MTSKRTKRVQSIELDSEPHSIREAREFVSTTLAGKGIDMWEAVLVTSELAANVVVHAKTRYSVGVDVSPSEVRIEVQDGAAALEVATDLSRETGGYGLRVVESLATDWGVVSVPDGKVVWVTLPRRREKEPPTVR